MSQGKPPVRTGVAKVAYALSHPERLRILMSMNSPLRRVSPNEWSLESGTSLGSSSYHFRVLEKSGCLKLVEEKPVRGATEHFFEPVTRAMAWQREWEALPTIVKQNIAAVSARGYVESLGRAIDAGAYDERPEAHISNDTFWTDERGWKEATTLFDEMLQRLLTIASESRGRLDESPDAERILMSYGLSAFETVPDAGRTG